MVNGLKREIAELQFGDHLCMVYQSSEEKTPAIVSFIQEGLSRDAYCIYVADESTAEEVAGSLNASGVDVAEAQKRGNFQFLTKWEYRRQQDFDLEAMAEVVSGLVGQALVRGYAGLWLAVEMTWTLDPEVDPEQLLRWETLGNTLLHGSPALALCLYDSRRLAPPVLHSAVRTHPHIFLGDCVHPNLYYEPPHLALSRDAYSEKVDWMLAQLQHLQGQQQALAQSEKLHRLLAENARDVVFRQRLVPELKYEYISPSITAFTGYAPDDFYNDPELIYKLVHPDDRHLIDAIQQSPESFKGPIRGRLTHLDGSLYWVEANITHAYDEAGNLNAVEGIIRDVTERKQAEVALQESEERYHALIEHSYGAVVLIDASGAFTYIGPSILHTLGYEPHELLGTNGFNLVHPDDLNTAQVKFAGVLELPKNKDEMEVRVRHKDAGWRWFEVTGANLLDEPAVQGVVVNFRDISERKEWEAALLNSAERLRQARQAGASVSGNWTFLLADWPGRGLSLYMGGNPVASQNTLKPSWRAYTRKTAIGLSMR